MRMVTPPKEGAQITTLLNLKTIRYNLLSNNLGMPRCALAVLLHAAIVARRKEGRLKIHLKVLKFNLRGTHVENCEESLNKS